jgi:TPR repeat protein
MTRSIWLALLTTLLSLSPVFAQGPSPFAAPSPAAPNAPVASATNSLRPYQTGYEDLMQTIARRADPLDQADLREIERRAQAGSREDQLAMGCLLSLGPAAQVTSPQMPNVNPARAAQYFEMAARSGSPEAQFFLGLMNLRGTGIRADRVSGAMWIQVASAAKLKPATKEAHNLSRELSPNELAQAQRRTNDWLAQHPNTTR